jgi:hypothetical protein
MMWTSGVCLHHGQTTSKIPWAKSVALVNSTLKMVRGKITEFYKDRMDYLFTAEGKNICDHQNKMVVKRLG